jgi:hypothetical protein
LETKQGMSFYGREYEKFGCSIINKQDWRHFYCVYILSFSNLYNHYYIYVHLYLSVLAGLFLAIIIVFLEFSWKAKKASRNKVRI